MIQNTLMKVIHELHHTQHAEIEIDGFRISMSFIEDGNRVYFTTPVYYGDNYIPKSVRKCLTEQIPFAQNEIKVFFTVDEEQCRIDLNHIDYEEVIQKDKLPQLLSTFAWMAEQWRNLLEENDRHDLIHIRVK